MMDPLSDVLSLLKPQSFMFRGLDLGGSWSIHFPAYQCIRCYALLTGECWFALDGAAAIRLRAGDCILLPRGHSFVLASELSLEPVNAASFLAGALEGGVITHQGGGEVTGIGGYFTFANAQSAMFLDVLPDIVHICAEADRFALRWFIERLMQELRVPQPGSYLLAQQLVQQILVQVLRLCIARGAVDNVGWIFALADPSMNAALSAMHANPSNRWTLDSLAELASMSRSSFASKFKKTVGLPAIEYLSQWRMLLAKDRLVNSKDSIAVISRSLGYESESAFSTAFKRLIGCSPRHYVSTQQTPSTQQTRMKD